MNATATQTRKPKNRTVALQRPYDADGVCVVRITQGSKVDHYGVRRLASDFGAAFRCRKVDGTAYDVLLCGPQSSCECKGFLRWGGECKHIAGLRALVSRGVL